MNKITVRTGDLTTFAVDAIVNAANEAMLGGGGVDGAIHRAAGPELAMACREAPEVSPGVRCPTGEARITPGFRLPARFVIHTVGPVWQGGTNQEDALLASCYRACLELAASRRLTTIAFPTISCGVYRFPADRAAGIAVSEIAQHLSLPTSVEHVTLVAFDAAMSAILEEAVVNGASA